MDLIFPTLITIAVGAGLLAALVALIIHPRVDQLVSGEWLPEPLEEPPDANARPERIHPA